MLLSTFYDYSVWFHFSRPKYEKELHPKITRLPNLGPGTAKSAASLLIVHLLALVLLKQFTQPFVTDIQMGKCCATLL